MSVFASHYARAFAEAVGDSKMDAAEVSRQLDDFAFAWNESRELRQFMESPEFPAAKKVAVLDKLNERIGLSRLTRNLLAVLIGNDRIGAFNEVLADYYREMDRRQGIFEVGIASARTLDDAERQQLEKQVGQTVGGRVKARYHEDPALLGGVVVTVGSTVYDGSVRGRLDRLKEELAAS